MKKSGTLFALLLLVTISFSQLTVTVSGSVLDVDGNGVDNIDVHIVVDSTNTNFSYYNTVQTVTDGAYSDSFEVPAGMTQGTVIVYIQDCNNANLSQMSYWSPGGDPVIDFLYCNVNCSVNIEQDSLENILTAYGDGIAPFAYEWNTGETTASISVNQTGNYCVTLTDANGCVSSTCFYFQGSGVNDTVCYVTIQADSVNTIDPILTANANGEAPFTYLWDTGENTQSIIANEAGEYCVSVIDNTRCLSSACIDLTENFSCDVYVYVGNASLLADAYGVAPFSYEWNTGETTQNIVPGATGTYCVTITDANGCTSSNCAFYQYGGGNDSLCYVTLEVIQNGTWLQANASGEAPFTYLWDTGGSTQSVIAMTENIVYCVSIVDATGCISTACYDNTLPGIEGYVFTEDSLFINSLTGTVDLYAIEGDEVTLIESVTFTQVNAGGFFSFENLPDGDYIVQAVVDSDIPESIDYLPTYHFSSEWWYEADIITLPENQNTFYNIMLLSVEDDDDGPGIISGGVYGDDGLVGDHEENDDRDNDPAAGVEILLHNDIDEAIAYTFTGTDGSFIFENLAYGTYTVYIEIPGLEQAFYTITIGPDNETISNIIFTVGETITTATREALLEEQFVVLYPNPVKNTLNVEMNLHESKIIGYQVVNLTGQVVLNQLFDGNQLNLSSLSTGVYILKVRTADGVIAQPFVKE